MPTGGKLSVISATGGGVGCSTTWDGFSTGDQFLPPSRLTSVKMSKKLAISKPPSTFRTVVLPLEASVGLSRSMTGRTFGPGGIRIERISVSKMRVLAVFSVCLTRTLVSAGALACMKVCPPSVEYWKSSSASNWKISGGHSKQGGGGHTRHGSGGPIL